MAFNSTPRTIIVTGGGVGIGAAISSAFYALGDKVVIASRTDSGLAHKLGGNALFVPVDLRGFNGATQMVESAVEWSGRIDILVNNVGISAWRSLDEIDESFLQNMLDTNLKSVFYSCKAAVPYMNNGGSIINISSLAGKRGSANNSAYCATKFGVNGLTQSLAKELGPKSIRVNAVCPVYVHTEGLEKALMDVRSPVGNLPTLEYLSNFAVSQSALGSLPKAEEVADTCVYLASNSSSAITGQCINVDCGVLPQ